MSFADVLTSASVFGNLAPARKTHVVLDLGAADEFYPSNRTILRLDAGRMLVRYGDSTAIAFPNGIAVRNIGRIDAPWHIEAGFSYRIGTLRSDEETSQSPERFSAGAQYSLFTAERGFFDVVRDESGSGGWFTWKFSKYFSLDSSATYFPRLIILQTFNRAGGPFKRLPVCAVAFDENGSVFLES